MIAPTGITFYVCFLGTTRHNSVRGVCLHSFYSYDFALDSTIIPTHTTTCGDRFSQAPTPPPLLEQAHTIISRCIFPLVRRILLATVEKTLPFFVLFFVDMLN